MNPMNPELTNPFNRPSNPSQITNLEQEFPEQAAKARLRNAINAQSGDIESQHGTTADISHMLCYGFLLLMHSLRDAESLDELRTVAEPFAEIAEDFFARMETGETKLPFIQKGLNKVVEDMAKRATAVAEALEVKDEAKSEKIVPVKPVEVEVPKAQSQNDTKNSDTKSNAVLAKWQVEAQIAPEVKKEIPESPLPQTVTQKSEKTQNVNKKNINKHIARMMGSNK